MRFYVIKLTIDALERGDVYQIAVILFEYQRNNCDRKGIHLFKDDNKLFDLWKEKLYSAVICDIMEDYAARDNTMSLDIRPLNSQKT